MTDILAAAWRRIPAKPFLAGYLALYLLMLWVLAQGGLDPVEPLFVLGTLGLFFTLLAWLLTRRATPPAPLAILPGAETAALLAYLVVFAFGFLGWALSWLKAALPDPRVHALAVT